MSDDMKVPEYFEGEVYIAMSLEGYDAGTIKAWGFDIGISSEYLAVGQVTIKVNLDQKLDARSALISGLTKQKADILAEAHVKAEAVQHKIDDLLQIEYKEVES